MDDFIRLVDTDAFNADTMLQAELDGHEFLVARVGEDKPPGATEAE
jgi:hypothetical protein